MTLYPHATLSTSISNVLTRGGPLWARSRNYPAEVCSSNTLNGKRSDLSVRYVYYIPTIHTTCSPSLMPCIFPREKNSFEFLSFQLNNSRHSWLRYHLFLFSFPLLFLYLGTLTKFARISIQFYIYFSIFLKASMIFLRYCLDLHLYFREEKRIVPLMRIYIPYQSSITPISRCIITKFERNIVFDYEEAEVEEAREGRETKWNHGGEGKAKGRGRERERESYRQFMRPHLPLGNRVSLKRRVDSFVGCVINSSTTSRQITRLGCITI